MNFETVFTLNKKYKNMDRMYFLCHSLRIVSDMIMEIEENIDKIQKNNCEKYAIGYCSSLEKIQDGLIGIIRAEKCENYIEGLSNYFY